MVAIRNTHVKGKLDLEAWWNSLNVTPEERTKIQKVFEYCHNKIQETDDNMLRPPADTRPRTLTTTSTRRKNWR